MRKKVSSWLYNLKELIKRNLGLLMLWYLRQVTRLQIIKIHPKVIGVTGSCGKTSLCQILATILKHRYRVRETSGLNSETGIPLAIFGLRPKNYTVFDWLRLAYLAAVKVITNWEKYDIFIAEMGIDSPQEPKNMSYLFKIIRPEIGIVTNISLEHS